MRRFLVPGSRMYITDSSLPSSCELWDRASNVERPIDVVTGCQRHAVPSTPKASTATRKTIYTMALPLPPGLTPAEVAFLCEMELVSVIPRQRLEGLELLGVSESPNTNSDERRQAVRKKGGYRIPQRSTYVRSPLLHVRMQKLPRRWRSVFLISTFSCDTRRVRYLL